MCIVHIQTVNRRKKTSELYNLVVHVLTSTYYIYVIHKFVPPHEIIFHIENQSISGYDLTYYFLGRMGFVRYVKNDFLQKLGKVLELKISLRFARMVLSMILIDHIPLSARFVLFNIQLDGQPIRVHGINEQLQVFNTNIYF